MKGLWTILCFILIWCPAGAQEFKTENVILVTFDGLRWQEVFAGADKKLLRSEKYTPNPDAVKNHFWHHDPQERRKLLMPFFWSNIATQGQLLGNRKHGNKMNLATRHWISYPGYNEMLSGAPDPILKHNRKIHNPNVTVLEWVNQQPGFKGKVAVVGSWNLLPYIVNTERSGITVNAGNSLATGRNLTPEELRLNEQFTQTKPRWHSVRQDTITFQYGMAYLERERPRLLHLAFGETDEHAHEGNYGAYLESIYQSDAMIRQLWEWLQSQEQYRNKTTLIIATDHGRGYLNKLSWKKHGRFWYPGSNHVWAAILGPDTPPAGEVKLRQKNYQYQIAGTIAYFLGLPFRPHQSPDSPPMANP
ncbi:alkaline phosphatase family protein [Pontibacter populi]|uniref:Alkaline phosphatase family protein n=1 Tax=Pontibacter populi TaxID=890055 RepID=A0ABV1RQI3_9BACT